MNKEHFFMDILYFDKSIIIICDHEKWKSNVLFSVDWLV